MKRQKSLLETEMVLFLQTNLFNWKVQLWLINNCIKIWIQIEKFRPPWNMNEWVDGVGASLLID